MNNQKLENLLNLSLNATPEEREKSMVLSEGVNQENIWTLIIKYVGTLERLSSLGITPVLLLGGYAIIEIPENLIDVIAQFDEIIYIEKPKNLFFTVTNGRRVSCVSEVQNTFASFDSPQTLQLYGEGCIVGIVDSGIDYTNSVFLNPDGTSRIIGIWDQTVPGNPPSGYTLGTYYDHTQINEALRAPIPQREQIVNSTDISGHGTAVASIAAGNFAPDKRNLLGMAVKSDLLVVKLGRYTNDFPRTSELMQAVDFLVKKCVELNRPLALNLSFGNNYGSHTGSSILETYLDIAASTGRTSLVIGTGNEGIADVHTSGLVSTSQTVELEFSVSQYETALNIQFWKAYEDTMEIQIETPKRQVFTLPSLGPSSYRVSLSNTNLLVYYGEPSPYQIYQEIFFDFLPASTYLDSGIWKLIITGKKIIDGEYHLWMPVQSALNGSHFLTPSPFATLTIPSTCGKAISVGAYNSNNFSYAPFSGRGYDRVSALHPFFKPDLVAPGVDITTAAPGGGFLALSGTSMAAPFVTGAAALLMEWGIIDGNDPFLYGEKVKAFLRKGAKPLTGFDTYPNPYIGYGALCVANSLPG